MKYISHIKELVSGIIVNDLVTRDTEAYNALIALKNHLDTLEEVYKYMPYKDPGPVIQKLEQSLTQANTKNQELQKQILYFDEELEKKTKSRDQCYQYWQEYKSKYETLEQKNQELKEDLKQKDSYIENLKKQTSDAQCDLDTGINYKGPDFENQINKLEEETKILRSLLTQEQEEEYQEYLREQEPDDQPKYKPKKRRAN